MKNENRCRNCIHFAEEDYLDAPECREGPPVALIYKGDIVGTWPKVRKSDWCAKFADREFIEKLQAKLDKK